MIEEVKEEIELNECVDCGEEIPAGEDDGSGVCEECRDQNEKDRIVETWDLADDWSIQMRFESKDGVDVWTYWLVDHINCVDINLTETDLGKIIDLGVDQFQIANGGVSMAHAEVTKKAKAA
jgi:hypothetical protein